MSGRELPEIVNQTGTVVSDMTPAEEAEQDAETANAVELNEDVAYEQGKVIETPPTEDSADSP